MGKKEYATIDIIKFLFAIMIVLLHSDLLGGGYTKRV